jgi:outer membrane receptor protein involved in Fe transport
MRFMKCLLFVALIVFSIASFAGTVKGKISDAKTGEPLVGATVTLVSGSKKFNTTVNLDGSYTFRNVPVGSYNLKVKYSGYKATDEKSVEVKSANDVVVITEDLQQEVNEIAEVQVIGYRSKETVEAAKSIERRSNVVENVMSAKAIELSPDFTVANSLQRMSGVSFQSSNNGDGKYAIIRGMDQRYNTTLVNGIEIPSPDDKSRFVPMNIFPSDILQRLEVIKALTPNMEGNAIGGAMNLVMKDAPGKEEFKIFAAGGGNTLFSGSRPFYNFPHTEINKKSPYKLTNGGNATVSDFSNSNLQLSPISNPLNLQTGLTYGNRYLNKKLGFVLSLSYQDLFKGSNQVLINQSSDPTALPTPANDPKAAPIQNYPLCNDLYLNTISTEDKRFALNNKFDYVINTKNKISLYNLYVNMNTFESRKQCDSALEDVPRKTSYNIRTSWKIQSIYNSTLHGEHQLAPRVTLNWSAAYSLAKKQVPDYAQFTYEGVAPPTAQTPAYFYQLDSGNAGGDEMKHSWSHNTDQDLDAYVNLIVNRTIAHRNVTFEFGGMTRHKTRDNFYRDYDLICNTNGGQNITNVNTIGYQFDQTTGYPASGNNGVARNYSITENVSAGYGQFKFNAIPKLQVVGGLRLETTDQRYSTDLSPAFFAGSGHIYYYTLLPSLHLKYSIDDEQAIRASYFRGLIRPQFSEITPYYVPANENEAYDQQGNPTLKHTVADNYDLRYEIYPKKGSDQLLVGAFVKEIYNPIELSFSEFDITAQTNTNHVPILTPLNLGTVTNAGFELLATKYFGMFGISGNYTYTHSAITTSKSEFIINPRGASYGDTTITVNQTRPLQGQAQNIGNASLLFKDPKIGLDLQLAYVYTGERIQIVNVGYNLDTWQAPFGQLDFSFTEKIVKNVEVYGKVTNLTNEHAEYYIKTPYYSYVEALPYQDNPSKHIFIQQDVFKTSYLFGVRYKL